MLHDFSSNLWRHGADNSLGSLKLPLRRLVKTPAVTPPVEEKAPGIGLVSRNC